jgi:acyl-CoA synthetase (AMP-forming)/AMP-acid ligase II
MAAHRRLAYLVDGEMVMCGRIKDVIIIGGRNIFPEEVERRSAISTACAPGNVVAFGVDSARGKEAIVIVAETNSDDPHDVARRMAQRVVDTSAFPRRTSCSSEANATEDVVGQATAIAVPHALLDQRIHGPRWQSHAIRR